jgi:hypothetical protein
MRVIEAQCEKASGREDVHVYNTRHKGTDSAQSAHAEASIDNVETTAMMATNDVNIDWRKRSDGNLMARKLREIEQEEAEYSRTGMRPARRHDEWRMELETAMKDRSKTTKKRVPVYQASAYDTGSASLRYEDFTSQAQ